MVAVGWLILASIVGFMTGGSAETGIPRCSTAIRNNQWFGSSRSITEIMSVDLRSEYRPSIYRKLWVMLLSTTGWSSSFRLSLPYFYDNLRLLASMIRPAKSLWWAEWSLMPGGSIVWWHRVQIPIQRRLRWCTTRWLNRFGWRYHRDVRAVYSLQPAWRYTILGSNNHWLIIHGTTCCVADPVDGPILPYKLLFLWECVDHVASWKNRRQDWQPVHRLAIWSLNSGHDLRICLRFWFTLSTILTFIQWPMLRQDPRQTH